MIEQHAVPQGLEGLSDAEIRRILTEILLPEWTAGAVQQDRPVVVVVAGPPGSGKSTAAEMIHTVLSRRGGAVRIGSDLYKRAHREYEVLLERDVRTAGAGVRPVTRWWQAEIEAYARAAGLDVVVELALADPAEARTVSALYRAAGYWIELVVLAVAEADSQFGALERFLAPGADGGRYVAWDNQDHCSDGLLTSLEVIEAEHLVDRITAVRRGLEPLYDNELTDERIWGRPPAAVATVRAERLRPWSGPRSRIFRHKLVRAEVLVHDERLPVDHRLAVSRDAERAAAVAEPVRRIAHPLSAPPGTGYHRLSADQHRWTFDELIAPTFLRKATFRPDPLVVYLVGEAGARQLEARRMLRRAMRPGTVVLDPDVLRGHHPDHFQLVNDTPRIADELVRPDAEDWQAEAEAYVRERRGDLLVEADFTSTADFTLSAGRFARADYQIEVVALAGRAADSRQRTLVDHARALGLDVVTALPAPAAHARGCQVAAGIVAAAAADPGVSAVRVIDGEHRALGRDRWAAWALAAARRRPYTQQEAARFQSVQRALHQVLPRWREEIAGITAQAQPLMPAAWQARQVEQWEGPARLPLPAADTRRVSQW
ncbi:zeta toxin family protein [Streptomyces sp. ISL-43]|uniref:zeta toxin family protein n=1 Tax=Streptomyces sp. ISL-43 TaxID=2819183 RepID=UPI001BE60D52|nr:zeta toxin family protein [Streptomyces sp. ISL-43]MBT2446200.1 zeta toxin family protein [Streptomyces sp. ISL-43]